MQVENKHVFYFELPVYEQVLHRDDCFELFFTHCARGFIMSAIDVTDKTGALLQPAGPN